MLTHGALIVSRSHPHLIYLKPEVLNADGCSAGWLRIALRCAAALRDDSQILLCERSVAIWRCEDAKGSVPASPEERAVESVHLCGIFACVCACDWMVKCGINSRTSCELRQLQQVASALCTHAASLVDCFGTAEMFWLASRVYIEVAPFLFLTPLLKSLVCKVLILYENTVNEQSWLISLMFQWKLELSQWA